MIKIIRDRLLISRDGILSSLIFVQKIWYYQWYLVIRYGILLLLIISFICPHRPIFFIHTSLVFPLPLVPLLPLEFLSYHRSSSLSLESSLPPIIEIPPPLVEIFLGFFPMCRRSSSFPPMGFHPLVPQWRSCQCSLSLTSKNYPPSCLPFPRCSPCRCSPLLWQCSRPPLSVRTSPHLASPSHGALPSLIDAPPASRHTPSPPSPS